MDSSDIIIQLGMLSDDKSSLIKEDKILIGALNPYNNKNKIDDLIKKNKSFFFRIASQDNKSSIYGYIIIPSKS